MSKSNKKLQLNKEAIAQLNEVQQAQIYGGTTLLSYAACISIQISCIDGACTQPTIKGTEKTIA
jgi:hypothetical protein